MGYTLREDGWIRCAKVESTVVQVEPTTEPTEPQSTTTNNLQQIQQGLDGVKTILIAMKEYVDKIREVTKETGTNVVKLRMDMGATRRQVIRAFNSMTEKMDKITKEVETSYDFFCTKGEKRESKAEQQLRGRNTAEALGNKLLKIYENLYDLRELDVGTTLSKDSQYCLTASEEKIMMSNTVAGALFQEGTSQAKNLLYNAISGEEYEKISSCESAKEMWDKLEVTYEGTNKVKETRINLLVRDYKLFQMKDGEFIEEIFSRFSKIRGDLKSFCRPIRSGEQVRKILRSLLTIWQPKLIALECQDLDKISYNELRGDLIAFEKTHLDMQVHQEKRKTIAFTAIVAESEIEEEKEVVGGEQDENIAMLSKVVTSMMRRNTNNRRGKPNFRKGKMGNENENEKNDGRCYECGKHEHIQAECPELKKKLSRNLQKKKSFVAWSDEEEYDHEKISNMCFMIMNDDSDEDSSELGLVADEGTSEVLNELLKIQREKKYWALKLEVCEIEKDMLQEEVHDLQLQLNGLRKSTSQSFI
ncbi:uncharacterized protein [Nicotiana tomentosiformis]|uniref:uncharacterized protein n=1 Tax=Nicotiana tomentosiformis TaxID=4098 RepID=UPI00388CAB00